MRHNKKDRTFFWKVLVVLFALVVAGWVWSNVIAPTLTGPVLTIPDRQPVIPAVVTVLVLQPTAPAVSTIAPVQAVIPVTATPSMSLVPWARPITKAQYDQCIQNPNVNPVCRDYLDKAGE